MALTVGSRLGHYDVTALIGEGGMGQVYQATDTTLNRQVALKILPEAFAADPDRLARFQREAQVLASLNHPNIAAIYGIEEAEDTRALVLELVEGLTLADRIAQGPIPVDEALPIAKQIAEALEAAHEAGVIHRDLKPANIKVRDDGTVKVLDFGLARAFQPDAASGDASQSPTLTAAATQMGVILGTAAYMAPEQAKGRTVDKRADIWAFGAVLYEMLTGMRAFQGEDISDTLATVLKSDPEWNALPADIPVSLRQVLRACLEKNPKQRVHDVADVRLAMEGAFETVAPSITGAPQNTQMWLVGATAAVVATLITVAVMWSLRSDPPVLDAVSSVEHVSVTLPDGVSVRDVFLPVALSPDGRHLVFVGDNATGSQLYHRAFDQRSTRPIPGTEGALFPFFSPDSQWIGFSVDGTLMKVSLAGESPAAICELPDDAPGSVAWWGPDERIWLTGRRTGLWEVSAAGGAPEATTTLAEGEFLHARPHPLANGRGVVFTVFRSPINEPRNAQVAVYSHETGEHRVLAAGGSAQFAPSGHLVFVNQDGELSALPFDAETLRATGVPVPVLDDVRATGMGGFLQFHVADDGSLGYVPSGSAGSSLVWVDRAANEAPIEAAVATYRNPNLSPDGLRIAVGIAGDNHDIYVLDLQDSLSRRLTFDPARDANPLWAPSGDRIVFQSERGEPSGLLSKAADGTGPVTPLWNTPDRWAGPASWSRDGHLLVTEWSVTSATNFDIGVITLNGEPTHRPLLAEEHWETVPQISPDGRYIAYESWESGPAVIYVHPFPNVENGTWQISGHGALDPRWSRDGTELFYRRQSPPAMMAVPVTTEPSFSHGTAQPLFNWVYDTAHGGNYDVAADRRFLREAEGYPAGTSLNGIESRTVLSGSNTGPLVRHCVRPRRPTSLARVRFGRLPPRWHYSRLTRRFVVPICTRRCSRC